MLGLSINGMWLDELDEEQNMVRWLPRIKSVRIEGVTESAVLGCYEIHLHVFFSGGYCKRSMHIAAYDELGAVTQFIKTYSCHVTFGVGNEQSSD
jgi:hypothetical protein